MIITDERNGRSAGSSVRDAVSFLMRFRGMIARPFTAELDGMLFRKCSAVHTFFMSFPIDILLLDRENRILRAAENVPPWKPCIARSGTAAVLELPAGTVKKKDLREGDCLVFEESSAEKSRICAIKQEKCALNVKDALK